MKQPKIIVAGIGPGSEQDITPAVLEAVREADVVVGYKYYFRFIQPYLHPETECIDTGMKRERTRAEQAFELAEQGKTVCVISSGDAGIYGMTPLIYEMKRERNSNVEVIALPGISAFQKAASLLGAPVGHDFCVISLSDLMTPWERIERRICIQSEKRRAVLATLSIERAVSRRRTRSGDSGRLCTPGRTGRTGSASDDTRRFQSRRSGYVYGHPDR